MKYKSGNDLMNLPNYIKFGCELEMQNVNYKELKELLKMHPELEKWKVTLDQSLTDEGVEVVSPPLDEKTNPNVYKEFQKVLDLAMSCPSDAFRKVYVNEQCGGHIHLDATKMRENPEMMESFLRLWAEAEEIIYKMCNNVDDPIRESAVKLSPVDGITRMLFTGMSELAKAADRAQIQENSVLNHLPKAAVRTGINTFNGYVLAVNAVSHPDGFAHPIGEKISRVTKHGDLIKGIAHTGKGAKYTFDKGLKQLSGHEVGINMQHISTNGGLMGKIDRLGKSQNLNTYEFRIHNGSLDLETWKQNIYLDSAISRVAYEMAYEPGKNDKKLSAFFDKDISEEEKADRFLDLLFDNEEDKKIYKERWESVKDEPVFSKAKGFSKAFITPTAKKTKSQVVADTMKKLKSQIKEFMQDERGGSLSAQDVIMDYGGRD